MNGLRAAAEPLLDEIAEVLSRVPHDGLVPLSDAIRSARRCILYGQGRAGLVMQALAMRLYHLGQDAHVVGAMTTPPVGPGDLLIVNAATGDLPTGLALMTSARKAGARIALITGVLESPAAGAADVILHLPAQTMTNDTSPCTRSVMPMGSQYELALFVVAELLTLQLMQELHVDVDAMRERHANLL